MVAWRNGDGRLRDDAPGGLVVRRRRLRNALIAIGVVVIVALASLWSARRPIANNVLANEMEKRGVQATYQPRPGRAAHPARSATSSSAIRRGPTSPRASPKSRCGSNGTAASRFTGSSRAESGCAAGWSRGRVSWGQVDKLLPPPSGKPFRFPDVSVDLADTTVALTSRYGALGVAVEGAGNLTGGFKGRLAAASPRLVPGKCELVGMRASLAVEIRARRPHAVGPLNAARFDCPQSRIALVAPQLELDTWFSEAFASFEGKARMAVQSLTAGDNGLAALNGNLTFIGNPEAARGDVNLSAQRARLGKIFADRRGSRANICSARRPAWSRWSPIMRPIAPASTPSVTAGLTGPLQSARQHAAGADRDGDRQRDHAHLARVRRDRHAAAGQCARQAARRGSRPPTRAGRAARGCVSRAATA